MGRRKIEIKAIKDDRNRSVYVHSYYSFGSLPRLMRLRWHHRPMLPQRLCRIAARRLSVVAC